MHDATPCSGPPGHDEAPEASNEKEKMLKCLKTIRSYTGHARWLAEIDETEPAKYLARVQIEDIPSPYAYGACKMILKWRGKSVVCFETSHKVYQVFEVPPELLRFNTDDEATNWHIRFSKKGYGLA